jgi:hypothetical protein
MMCSTIDIRFALVYELRGTLYNKYCKLFKKQRDRNPDKKNFINVVLDLDLFRPQHQV